MKSLYHFRFAYGQMGWKTRLSRTDHLYHQGRNALSLILCVFVAFMLSRLVMEPLIDVMTGMPAAAMLAVVWAVTIVLWLPVAYVAIAMVKLTILRLHDFNLSGWWFLGLVGMGVLDGILDRTLLPGITSFVSLQSLAYLALLIMPASAAVNRFGKTDANSTAGRSNIIRAVPLVLFTLVWLLGILFAFLVPHALGATAQSQIILQRAEGPLPNGTATVSPSITVSQTEIIQ